MFVRYAISFLVLTMMWGGAAQAKTGAELVSFTTSDGFLLRGEYYPGRPGSPVVLLLHQLGSTHADYTVLAKLLQSKDINALAYDARGHGESMMKDGEKVSFEGFSRREFLGMETDIAAALRFLKVKKGVGKGPVGIVGASIQSSTGLIYAAKHPEVAALVLLSPGLGYRDIDTLKPMREYGKRPVFIAVSDEDGYSLAAAKELDKTASGEKKLEVYSGVGHGAKMFSMLPGLPGLIADWLSAHLK